IDSFSHLLHATIFQTTMTSRSRNYDSREGEEHNHGHSLNHDYPADDVTVVMETSEITSASRSKILYNTYPN
ncbi:hypothetical protein L9F63_011201, partial [Diploptera punctata]